VAAINVDAWMPEDLQSAVIMKVAQASFIETYAAKKPMTTQTKTFPRSGGATVFEVARSGVYSEDANTNDDIVITAKKFGTVFRIPEEDIDDSLPDVLDTKKSDWGTAYAKFIDNAALATTGVISATVPFLSVYYVVTHADASTGYVANANYASITGAVGQPAVLTYAAINALFANIESSDFYDEGSVMTVAHPTVKSQLRGVLDSTGNPIFSLGYHAGGADVPAALPEVFGYPIKWSLGARTNATASQSPTGNPLIIAANVNYLFLGIRSGPETVVIDGMDGAAALTDETLLKVRARRGFGVAIPAACAVLELIHG
jgi:HK97 family phage major capsid protein